MITHIAIRDFAIIEDTEVSFDEGLNVITGETGSGKSIVVTAISLALGSRADTAYIRHGKDRATVELLGELYGEEISLSREVNASGRNLCHLNGRLVTLGELQETAELLADIHGQYDNQSLLNPENHLSVVDNYNSEDISPAREEYVRLFSNYQNIRSELGHLLSLESESARKLDFYKYEIAEIDAASPRIGEAEELSERINLLQNSETIFSSVKDAYENIGGDGGSMETLWKALSQMESLASFSGDLKEMSDELSDIYYRVEDINSNLRNMMEKITYSPEELNSSIERLSLLEGLMKKYGPSMEDVLCYRDKISAELAQIENFDEEKARLEEASSMALSDLIAQGEKLRDLRIASSKKLAKEIESELADLNFKEAKLSVGFSALSEPGPEGLDAVEILISTNLGEPLKPLVKVASGGEISRIMLAIKSITAEYDNIPTLIFDEIDQGISGKTAAVVGRKLKEISVSHQVLCITHLPQIAAVSASNYRIYKESDDTNTYTHIEKLTADQKIEEVARLLGGETITEAARENARELIGENR